jgi:hypothetical protein
MDVGQTILSAKEGVITTPDYSPPRKQGLAHIALASAAAFDPLKLL